MLNPDGILFDLDGTLVDTSRDISANLNRSFLSHGYPELPHETILKHVGRGAHFLVEQCIRINQPGANVDEKLVTEIWEGFRAHYRLHLVDHAQPYPGVIDLLQKFPGPMGVVSNKPEEFVLGVLWALGLQGYFKFMWGRDTLPVSKPDPEVIRYGMHELDCSIPAKVCMVGDNPVDIIAARGAGAVSVALCSGFSSKSDLADENPDHLFDTFLEFAHSF